jgi:predicted nucleotidyltransferase
MERENQPNPSQVVVREARRWGNSAGILLPREWVGNQVKVILIDRSLEIKKEVLSILEPYLEDIIGIYLTGSYARREETSNSDVDIVAISKNTKKTIKSGKYDISIITLENAKKTIEKNPILILPRLNEARVILNPYLLEELKAVKIEKKSFRKFIEGTNRMIKINKGFLDLDKKQKLENISTLNIIYSLILRLRGMFLAKCLLNKRKYSKKEFFKFLGKTLSKEELEKIYKIYEAMRDDRKTKEKIKVEVAEKLLNALKSAVKKWQKERKNS